MSFARVLANIVVQGTAVFGKAFMQAYANAASQAGKTAADGAQAIIKKGQMTRGEAIEILGVTSDLLKHAPEEVHEKYEKFLNANDPSNGGSFYLQSKIFRAKEFLDEEAYQATLKEEAAAAGEEADATAADGEGETATEGTEGTEEDDEASKRQQRRDNRRQQRRDRR